ncbi:hypothetical protein LX36DRAFT_257791 [Colletotrichum falcatum]|nr:hypothetical protein LX36DRAFT_257791 [Colletotrichum falcatum]
MPCDSLKSGIYSIPPSQDSIYDTTYNSTYNDTYDITYDLPSTKFLGTFRSMATASSTSAENRPLNANAVFPPGTPPSRASASDHHHPGGDDGRSPRVLTRFAFSPIAALRVATIPFAIVLVVVEVQGKSWRDGLATFFIIMACMQLNWLVAALLTQSHFVGGGGGGRRGDGFTVDLGFVQCIFGRRRRRGDDAGEGEGTPTWMKDGGSKRSGRANMVYTAIDVVFGIITLIAGIVAATDPACWSWGLHVGVAIVGIFLAILEGVIALAEQFSVLRRGRIQVMWDAGEEAEDLSSHKYRIRLPQSPEQRHTTMSVAA